MEESAVQVACELHLPGTEPVKVDLSQTDHCPAQDTTSARFLSDRRQAPMDWRKPKWCENWSDSSEGWEDMDCSGGGGLKKGPETVGSDRFSARSF